MNVIILGSEGQIGKPLKKYLKSKGYTIIGIDKKISKLHDLETEDGKALFKGFLRDIQIDRVIFLAFNVGGSRYLRQQDKSFDYIQSNVTLMANTFQVLQDLPTPFLFASSQMSNMFHTNYGFLKNLGERYTDALPHGRYCKFWNVYDLEDVSTLKAHVITDFIHKALTTGEINMLTDGLEERQFLHVDDCNKCLELWIKDPDNFNDTKIDITSFQWTSIRDIADIVAEEVGDVKVKTANCQDEIQGRYVNEPDPDILAIWEPKITIEEGISRLVKKARNA